MPVPVLFFRLLPARLGVACLAALMLSSCMTNKKTVEAAAAAEAPQAAQPAGSEGLLAKGGTTASSRYVDPTVSTGEPRHQARAPAGQQTGPDVAPAAGFPPAPEQPPSIAGLATQPTGVRAGSVSIFSSGSPAPAPSPHSTGSVPNSGPISATNGSMFTPRQPLPPTNCGSDAKGNALAC